MPNLLKHEDSPYLLQHKENPIHWYPWCDKAFEDAKEQNRPIFISIGYSTCHWCHVMEREVFENVEMAKFLNEHFICIKVDKEERPDIDIYYQNVYQTLNKKTGGWPTSIFCTPTNKPFFAATYMPLEPKYNIVGFRDVTELITTKISTQDAALLRSADEIETLLLQKSSKTSDDVIDLGIQKAFIIQCKNNFEPTYGGFTISTKFPQVATLDTMMSIYELKNDDELKSMILHTLDNMIAGGFYDLIDGGFCRYSVDAEWLVPHFEKMSYDNGLLCKLYLRAFGIFGVERYFEIAQETGEFIQKFMMEDFFIYSASDAETQGIEGEYFVYSRKEILRAIEALGYDEREAKRMAMRLLVSNSGNFEGKNIIHFANIKKEKWFESVRGKLQKLRQRREYPFIDKRLQTSWCAMVIESFFSLSLYDDNYKTLAEKCLEQLLKKMYKNRELKHSSLIEKDAKGEVYLEDYAYLSKMLLYAYEVTAREEYLELSKELTDKALKSFYKDGIWKFSTAEFLIVAELEDGSYPSSVAVMVEVLLSLGTIIDEKYRVFAYQSLDANAAELKQKTILHSSLTQQCIRYFVEDRILKIPVTSSYREILESYNYPFLHIMYHKEEYYELCSNSSCFYKGESLPATDSVSS